MTVVDVTEKHQDLVDELLAAVSEDNPDADLELSTRAFAFAARAHDGQLRRSGEDFIRHPFGRSRRSVRSCASTRRRVAAALLHDVVEDTDVELDDLRAEFGGEIAQLVEGVTKLTRIQFQTREQAQAENYRKMIVAMADDVRVILIKLADRLHNMRTIEYLGEAEAGAEVEGDARGLRAARAPPRHPHAEVGARGPRLRDAPSAQVRGDQGDGRRAARRPRGARARGRRAARGRAREGRHRRARSRRARSTSTRSTRRWRRRAASSTRSTT